MRTMGSPNEVLRNTQHSYQWHFGGSQKITLQNKSELQGTNIRYFRNPCDRDPPTENFKNFKFFKNSLKTLNVYFLGTNVYFGGNERFLLDSERLLLGNERLLLGIIGVFVFWGISLFVAGGFGDSVGRGARRGFRKYLTQTPFKDWQLRRFLKQCSDKKHAHHKRKMPRR